MMWTGLWTEAAVYDERWRDDDVSFLAFAPINYAYCPVPVVPDRGKQTTAADPYGMAERYWIDDCELFFKL
jgi:hypothetical protein